MSASPITPATIDRFIARWDGTEMAERANYARFLDELCQTLNLPTPDPASGSGGNYRYERGVAHTEDDGSPSVRRIDLFKQGCFVLEAKQGSNPKQTDLFGLRTDDDRRTAVRRSNRWAQDMLKAKGQAEGYVADLKLIREPPPPFIIVCDVGFCFDIYADFSATGAHYTQFPDRDGFRVYLKDLHNEAVRDRLIAIWTDPLSLDPSRQRVQVTRDIAAFLARLVKALEAKGHAPQAVATFLMRCIFCMFAQSVGLLPTATSFTELLLDCRNNLPGFIPLLREMWQTMNSGGFSTTLRALVWKFNGGLFSPEHGLVEPLPLDADMLNLLITAAGRDWADVEPAIFGTLLENALDTRQRGELGAHFTPRAFVERLVRPTVMDPLREEWDGVKAAAVAAADAGNKPEASKLLREFHARLCQIRVLDPACGTGNFLYVTLEMMKRLEGEVLDVLADLVTGEGDRLDLAGASVDPHQFLGLEKNPRAVPVAELVLWIGWLQWHFRTRGKTIPAEPILRNFQNIRHQDALLDYTKEEQERDRQGNPVTRWGGATKLHPITGEAVPDETDRVLVMRPVAAKAAEWPEAEFIVGNPPFIAGKDLRAELGPGYAEALWAAYPKVPKSADIAMFFWWKAAQALRAGKVRARKTTPPVTRRFGFITSNSIRQVFCRRVIAEAMEAKPPASLLFAIPDHPWTDGKGTAAVRIAMTVAQSSGASGAPEGILLEAVKEAPGADGIPIVEFDARRGRINADFSIGTDVKSAKPLKANDGLSSRGMSLHGAGFIVSPSQAQTLGLGRVPGLDQHIRPYLNGRDLTAHSRGQMVIDLFGLSAEDVRRRFPAVYQHVQMHVKPERDQNNRPSYRENWWVFGEPRRDLRPALHGLSRFIVTVETAKHRVFLFCEGSVIPDNKLVVIALDDAFSLGVLQSNLHVEWMLAQGNWLGVGNDPVYVKTQCFDPFPFPAATSLQRQKIAAIAEELDALRKQRLAAHSHLTLTGLYNVLEKLRAGTPLTPAERDIHEAGHLSILRELHDRLDEAVAEAYGWPANLSDAEIIARIVALNAERVAEEATGLIRWLRPEFQAAKHSAPAARAVQADMRLDEAQPGALRPWPKDQPGQFVALRQALSGTPATPAQLARLFDARPTRAKIETMAQALTALGQARVLGDGRYVA